VFQHRVTGGDIEGAVGEGQRFTRLDLPTGYLRKRSPELMRAPCPTAVTLCRSGYFRSSTLAASPTTSETPTWTSVLQEWDELGARSRDIRCRGRRPSSARPANPASRPGNSAGRPTLRRPFRRCAPVGRSLRCHVVRG
jgi:hypothetical protein